jgi:hypothetical protein
VSLLAAAGMLPPDPDEALAVLQARQFEVSRQR